jgi:hypothetical protein
LSKGWIISNFQEMSFYLVDPQNQSVTVINKPKFNEYCKLIGCTSFEGSMTEVGNQEWTIYYDGEGMFKIKRGDNITLIPGVSPIPGKVVICKTDEDGDSVGLPISIKELRASIKFVDVSSQEALDHAAK